MTYTDNRFFFILYPTATGGNHAANLLSTHEFFFPRFSSKNYFDDLLELYKSKLNLDIKDEEIKRVESLFLAQGKALKFKQATSVLYNVHAWTKGAGKVKINQEKGVHEEIINIDGKEYKDVQLLYKNIKLHAGNTENSIHKNYICQAHTLNSAILHPTANAHSLVQTIINNLNDRKNITGLIFTKPKKYSRAYKRLHEGNLYIAQNNEAEICSLPVVINKKSIFDLDNSLIINTDDFFEDDGSYYFQNLMKDKLNLELPLIIHTIHKCWIQMIDKSIEAANYD